MSSSETPEARFSKIYDGYFEVVRRYVWRRDPLIADDVTAETFLVAWRRLDDVPTDAAPWLIAVARNIRLNEHRKARRQTAARDRLAREPGHGHDDTVAWPPGVVAALNALPARDREILLLSVWEDLDRAAIAAVLGCSKANVSVRLHRAHRRFKDELGRNTLPVHRPRHTTLAGGSDV